MKTPQRSFVVEFKSGRRQPKGQAGSIWGNTDLKSLAREVETEAAHLFGDKQLSGTGDTDHAADTDVSGFVDEPAVVTASEPTDTVADRVARAQSDDELADKASDSAIGPLTVAKTPSLPKRASGRKAPRPSPTTASGSMGKAPDLQSRSAPTSSLEELAALDAENSRLRKLLANQLRAQNATLKRMLARF